MSELPSYLGIGSADLTLAADREIKRLMKSANGNRNKALILALEKLVDMELITADEYQTLTKIYEIGFSSGQGKTRPEDAHIKCRRIADEMLATGTSSPIAVGLAYAEANSYMSVEDVDGTPTVVYSKKRESWETTLSGAGAVIGGVLGGKDGAALGFAIGKVVGKAVDKCLE